jgi:hypothetical protein
MPPNIKVQREKRVASPLKEKSLFLVLLVFPGCQINFDVRIENSNDVFLNTLEIAFRSYCGRKFKKNSTWIELHLSSFGRGELPGTSAYCFHYAIISEIQIEKQNKTKQANKQTNKKQNQCPQEKKPRKPNKKQKKQHKTKNLL